MSKLWQWHIGFITFVNSDGDLLSYVLMNIIVLLRIISKFHDDWRYFGEKCVNW